MQLRACCPPARACACSLRLEAVRRRQAALKRQLEEGYGQLGGLEARVAQLEGVRRGEEGRLEGLQREVRRARRTQGARAAQRMRCAPHMRPATA